ncbi:MAG TPA: hypothetical protein VKV95_18495 [Terriglobia bacterium]|nr:hypothetical protein [Terriglobia bacterium]
MAGIQDSDLAVKCLDLTEQLSEMFDIRLAAWSRMLISRIQIALSLNLSSQPRPDSLQYLRNTCGFILHITTPHLDDDKKYYHPPSFSWAGFYQAFGLYS